jgi:hypothetical protein
MRGKHNLSIVTRNVLFPNVSATPCDSVLSVLVLIEQKKTLPSCSVYGIKNALYVGNLRPHFWCKLSCASVCEFVNDVDRCKLSWSALHVSTWMEMKVWFQWVVESKGSDDGVWHSYWVSRLCPSNVILNARKHIKKLLGLSPRANNTDRATAACRRNDCQLLRIEGATWSAWRIPDGSLRPCSRFSRQRLSGTRSRPTTSQKIW